MKRWKMQYKIKCHCTGRVLKISDSWFSTSKPTIKFFQAYWDKIFKGNYTVLEDSIKFE